MENIEPGFLFDFWAGYLGGKFVQNLYNSAVGADTSNPQEKVNLFGHSRAEAEAILFPIADSEWFSYYAKQFGFKAAIEWVLSMDSATRDYWFSRD